MNFARPLKFLVSVTAALLVTACSSGQKTAKLSMTEDEVIDQLEEFVSTASGGGDTFMQLAQDPSTIVYFAEGPGMGPAESIVAMLDYGIFGLDVEFSSDIVEAKVFFLDGFIGGDVEPVRAFALAVQLRTYDGQESTTVFESSDGNYLFDGRQFSVEMSGGGGTIEVYSFDAVRGSGENLAPVIQLRIAEFDDLSGESLDNGKINNLVGISRD